LWASILHFNIHHGDGMETINQRQRALLAKVQRGADLWLDANGRVSLDSRHSSHQQTQDLIDKGYLAPENEERPTRLLLTPKAYTLDDPSDVVGFDLGPEYSRMKQSLAEIATQRGYTSPDAFI
jgi:hypothetical protein